MTIEAVIDLEKLLAPIAGDNPAGENLLYAGVFDEITEARRADDVLDQGEWQRERKTSNWNKVFQLATDSLASKTKDLQISAWLVESLVKIHKFVGFRDGLRLVRGLMEKYWDFLYPLIEDGDFDGRVNAISFIDKWASLALREIPLTSNVAGLEYSFQNWEDSKQYSIPENADQMTGEEADKIVATRERAKKDGKITGEQWRAAKNASKRAFYEETAAVLQECTQEVISLDKLMDDKFGRHTPGVGALKKGLDQIRSCVDPILKEKRILEPDEVPAAAEAAEAAETGAPSAPGAVRSLDGAIRGRQDALHRLTEIANFFRQTEPHSPVSYLVQRAVRWGQIPLESWLEDVIKDPGVLGSLKETLGIKVEDAGK